MKSNSRITHKSINNNLCYVCLNYADESYVFLCKTVYDSFEPRVGHFYYFETVCGRSITVTAHKLNARIIQENLPGNKIEMKLDSMIIYPR